MPAPELLANAILVLADIALLLAVARWRSLRALCWGVVAFGTAALLLAPVMGTAFGSLRILAAALFLHLPAVLAGAGLLLRARPRIAMACVLAAVAHVGVAVQAFVIEPRALEVNRHRLPAPGLERSLRIAVLADLQTDRAAFGEHEKRALRAVLAERPDLILLPGDFIQENDLHARAELAAELNAFLREIDFRAPLGAFAVGGDIDPGGWPAIFAGTNVIASRRRESFAVGGLHLTALDNAESSNLALTLPREGAFHVAFGHRPDFALSPRVFADLLIAGHTHGGQVRLPGIGPLLTLSHVPRSWAAGVTDLGGGRTLVVSRGVGLERGDAPRLRFLCRPEVVVLDLVPAPAR